MVTSTTAPIRVWSHTQQWFLRVIRTKASNVPATHHPDPPIFSMKSTDTRRHPPHAGATSTSSTNIWLASAQSARSRR